MDVICPGNIVHSSIICHNGCWVVSFGFMDMLRRRNLLPKWTRRLPSIQNDISANVAENGLWQCPFYRQHIGGSGLNAITLLLILEIHWMHKIATNGWSDESYLFCSIGQMTLEHTVRKHLWAFLGRVQVGRDSVMVYEMLWGFLSHPLLTRDTMQVVYHEYDGTFFYEIATTQKAKTVRE